MKSVDLKETEGIPEGLTSEEVAARVAEGKVNISNEKVGKSYLQILCDNLFTFFNFVWLLVAAILVICGSYSNMTFLAVVIPNIVIATFQEMKAKKTVEKLSVTTEPKATVIRDGELINIPSAEIVIGDVMLVETGRQVLSDAVVISGAGEANESMLTGESDAIKKEVGDKILAGSFFVGGSVYAKVTSVGRDNYVHKIETAAKNFKAPSSNLFHDLNKLIKSISIFLVPMSIVLFASNWLSYKDVVTAAVKTCGSVIGMIPAGIYLLVTLTLTLSVINLSRKQTLVQDMYSIEMLASADVLCLDKTGTITDGTMKVTGVYSLDGTATDEITRIMSHVNGTEQSINNTSKALIDYFGKDVSVKIIKKIPFSSTRKYSAVSIEGLGAFSIGAPHFVPCPVSAELEEDVERHALEGERVLILVRHEDLDREGIPLALITISDCIREGAAETIRSFEAQGVTLKVISGDHAATVSTIAKKVGITGAEKYISCDTLTDEEIVLAAEEYTVFGRVTPEQKVLLVKTFQVNGHTVAMTGDGVNDTLALKESNCAIAMADGSEMARAVSHIVLMNSDFTSLPEIVKEGRRCINNVRQSSVLFLMKTIFTVLLSIISVITFSGYPLEPKQLLLLELLVIGLASVLLALEPNDKPIRGSYLNTVVIKSFPSALALLLPVILLIIFQKIPGFGMSHEARNAIAMAMITIVGFVNLAALCTPMTKWRASVVAIIAVLLILLVPFSIFVFNDFIGFAPIAEQPVVFLCMIAASLIFTVIMQILRGKIEGLITRIGKTRNRRREDFANDTDENVVKK